jgi:FkbM family methyltransferase
LQPPTFLEIGAYDGLHASNTLFLEHCLGWRGLLIEAHPNAFERVALNRPRAWSVGSAVSDACDGNLRFSRTSRPQSQVIVPNDHARRAAAVDVPCVPLARPLAALRVRQLAAAFVDVEDFELPVLSSLDWSRVKVALLVVEERNWNGERTVSTARVRELLTARGMVHVLTSCLNGALCNGFFVDPNLVELAALQQNLTAWRRGIHLRDGTVMQQSSNFSKSCHPIQISREKWRWWPRMCVKGYASDDHKRNGTQPLCRKLFSRRLGLSAVPTEPQANRCQ